MGARYRGGSRIFVTSVAFFLRKVNIGIIFGKSELGNVKTDIGILNLFTKDIVF
jgi:hypothetical protein